MATNSTTAPISPLRQRMQHDMMMRGLSPRTQHHYVRNVQRFAAFLKRSPDTATPDEVRRFQLYLIESGASICNRNRIMTGVRFLFRVTLRRHDLAAEVWHLKEPQKLPPVRSLSWSAVPSAMTRPRWRHTRVSEMADSIAYAHRRGAKVMIAVNTFPRAGAPALLVLTLLAGAAAPLVVATPVLLSHMTPLELSLLLAGGVLYTAGVLFHVWERLPFQNAIWHLFVLGGTASHFFTVWRFVA